MFSSTTMALSTSMPMPSASPPRVIRFRVNPPKYISAKVATTEMGMAVAMMAVLRMLRRKKSSTTTASRPPYRMEEPTLRDGALDVVGGVDDRVDLDLRDVLVDPLDLLHDRPGDLDRVGAGLLVDRQPDAGLAVDADDRG